MVNLLEKNPTIIQLPSGHSWKNKDSVSMDYPPPDSMSGECLLVIGHSNELEDTLNTFYRKISHQHIPESENPEKDYVILYPYLNRENGYYFSIAELISWGLE